MCLLAFAWRVHPQYPLVLIANRDEFYARPAQAARYWPDSPSVLAGRDQQEGGTWLGVTRTGRWAALTNYREPNATKGQLSRGHLVASFLQQQASPLDYVQHIAEQAENYRGFNVVVGDRQQLATFGNRGTAPQILASGLYGLSNHLLDSPWPKTVRLKARLQALVAMEGLSSTQSAHLLALLQDTTQPMDEELPNTGVPLLWERLLATAFIKSPMYGTRASTVVLLGQTRCYFAEQTWLSGEKGELAEFEFDYDESVHT